MSKPSDPVQGTLDMPPKNGFAVSQRLKQVSGDVLQVSDGSLYAAFAQAGTRGLDYSRVETVRISPAGEILFVTRLGRRQLEKEADNWGRLFERHFAGDHA